MHSQSDGEFYWCTVRVMEGVILVHSQSDGELYWCTVRVMGSYTGAQDRTERSRREKTNMERVENGWKGS